MTASPTAGHPPVLVIGGMHRSGTSLTASVIAAAGIHLGDDLMAAGAGNPRGHFEDLAFYHLHQRILAANGLSLEGFTCQETIDVPPAARIEANELVARRRGAGRPWGWKDPRTVLLLDFWADLLPEARWLFVVRPPEQVVDSLLRRGDTAFIVNPRHAIDVWVAYNRRILEFVHRHQQRSVVVDLEQVTADPASLVATVSNLMGTVLSPPPSTYEEGLLVSGLPPHRAGLVRTVRPEAQELHAQLRRLAGLESAVDGGPFRQTETADAALAEWTISCRTGAAAGQLAAREADARQAAERLAAELETERAARSELAAQTETLTADRSAIVTALETERAAQGQLAATLETEQAAHLHARDRAAELERDVARCEQAIVTLEARWKAATADADAALDALATHRAAEAEARLAIERQLAEALARSEAAERTAARLETALADRDLAIPRLEAAHAEARARAEQLDAEATAAAGERHDLVAQLEAERAIHEALRQDMNGRIEAAVTCRDRHRPR
ncbi:MAG: sulfotransferase [Planctomycetota bacterium]